MSAEAKLCLMGSKDEKVILSVVTPCKNEEKLILECHARTAKALSGVPNLTWEHIFVDNSSTDSTVTKIQAIMSHDPRVRLIRNSRDFGIAPSMFNALNFCKGECVVPFLPADCQDPPEVIPEMLEKWRNGADVVYGIRVNRRENAFLSWARRAFYEILTRISEVPLIKGAGDFTLIDRTVKDQVLGVADADPFLRGIIPYFGANSEKIEYSWEQRKSGKSSNNLSRLLGTAINGITTVSVRPLRMVTLAGFAVSAISLAIASLNLLSFGLQIVLEGQTSIQPGLATLIVALFFFSGIILLAVGVLGEYVASIHRQLQRRPLVIAEEFRRSG